MFFVVVREEKGKKMIAGISGFGFFWSKNGRFVTQNCFPQNGLLKPLFYSVFWVRAFLAKLSKKGKFWTPTKKRKLFLSLSFFVFVLFFVLEGLRVR